MTILIRAITIISLLSAVVSVNAQQPDWVALPLVAGQAFDESSPELSKKIYLYQRCAGQQLAMSTVVAEANADLEKRFTESAMSLSQAATLDRANLARQRTGQDPDIANLSEATLEAIVQLYDQYMKWLNNNYLLNGSYFENDEDFQIEMELCSAASQMARLTMQELVEENSQP